MRDTRVLAALDNLVDAVRTGDGVNACRDALEDAIRGGTARFGCAHDLIRGSDRWACSKCGKVFK
jgi:hypothetical protein